MPRRGHTTHHDADVSLYPSRLGIIRERHQAHPVATTSGCRAVAAGTSPRCVTTIGPMQTDRSWRSSQGFIKRPVIITAAQFARTPAVCRAIRRGLGGWRDV